MFPILSCKMISLDCTRMNSVLLVFPQIDFSFDIFGELLGPESERPKGFTLVFMVFSNQPTVNNGGVSMGE